MSEMTQPLGVPSASDVDRDLGFGSVVSSQHNLRLLNRDGSFNVKLLHGPVLDRIFSYHSLLTMGWGKFFLLMSSFYLIINAIFAWIYIACGVKGLVGDMAVTGFARAFFFSVDSFATIGYGNVVPGNMAANIAVTLESLFGLMGFAVATGLVFARVSRPVADIMYSRNAVVAPYKNIQAFMFRVANRRRSQLVNVDAQVTFSRFEESPSGRVRRFYQLALERNKVALFPLNWTIVHPIDEKSPMHGWTPEQLREAEAEVFILLTGVDETFAQQVHSRSSYIVDDVKFGHRYQQMYFMKDGGFEMDLALLDATERPAISQQGK